MQDPRTFRVDHVDCFPIEQAALCASSPLWSPWRLQREFGSRRVSFSLRDDPPREASPRHNEGRNIGHVDEHIAGQAAKARGGQQWLGPIGPRDRAQDRVWPWVRSAASSRHHSLFDTDEFHLLGMSPTWAAILAGFCAATGRTSHLAIAPCGRFALAFNMLEHGGRSRCVRIISSKFRLYAATCLGFSVAKITGGIDRLLDSNVQQMMVMR